MQAKFLQNLGAVPGAPLKKVLKQSVNWVLFFKRGKFSRKFAFFCKFTFLIKIDLHFFRKISKMRKFLPKKRKKTLKLKAYHEVVSRGLINLAFQTFFSRIKHKISKI
jgi:hypothetical protein